MSRAIDLDHVARLENLLFRAWPALESKEVHGWCLRLSGGYTKRANSINALSNESQFTDQIRKELEAAYTDRDLPPVWRLSPLAPPEAEQALIERGYRRLDESLVQEARLDDKFAADPAIAIDTVPSADWLAGFARLSPVAPRHRETMEKMLRSIAAPSSNLQAGFARFEQAGQPVAFALGVVEGEHVGLFDVLVAPEARRQGLARRLTRSIGAWGRTKGARFSYLQVVASNDAARPLYASLGYETVYPYAYRVPPSL